MLRAAAKASRGFSVLAWDALLSMATDSGLSRASSNQHARSVARLRMSCMTTSLGSLDTPPRASPYAGFHEVHRRAEAARLAQEKQEQEKKEAQAEDDARTLDEDSDVAMEDAAEEEQEEEGKAQDAEAVADGKPEEERLDDDITPLVDLLRVLKRGDTLAKSLAHLYLSKVLFPPPPS